MSFPLGYRPIQSHTPFAEDDIPAPVVNLMAVFVDALLLKPYWFDAALSSGTATAKNGICSKEIGRVIVGLLRIAAFPPWSVSDSNPSMYPAWMGLLNSKSFGINRKNYIVSIVVSILAGSPHSEEIRRETNRKRVISVFETSPLVTFLHIRNKQEYCDSRSQ